MALVPEGASLEVTAEVTWPTIRLGNTWLLPGIPEVFRMKLPVVVAHLAQRERPRFRVPRRLRQDGRGGAQAAPRRVVASFPDVSVGSYPKWLDPSYKTKLTFDGRDEARVLAARDAFVASLPAGEPQRVD